MKKIACQITYISGRTREFTLNDEKLAGTDLEVNQNLIDKITSMIIRSDDRLTFESKEYGSISVNFKNVEDICFQLV